MMRRVLMAAALVALATGGCGGGGMSKVKGRLVSNGQPITVPGMTVGVAFTPVVGDKPDPSKVYTAVVNEDGSFELVASGGELPSGQYQVAIQATGKTAAQFKAFAGPGSPIRREFKPGDNDITIDVAKPDGG